jgi:hypothetical protein
MATYKVSMQFPMDSDLPKDRISINPHFFGDNPDALVQQLKQNLIAWPPTSLAPFYIKAYDAAHAPPSYPLATAEQAGTTPATSHPREIACCLSYYTGFNRPRYRGRFYIPFKWLGGTPGTRPTPLQRDVVLEFATQVLTKNLPAAHNWVMWSQVERKSQGGVSDIWCDDEWDTVRSRGLRATTRTVAKVA